MVSAWTRVPPEVVVAVTRGLAAGWPADYDVALDTGIAATLPGVLNRIPAVAQAHLLRVAVHWQTEALRTFVAQVTDTILATMADSKQGDAARIDAARRLIAIQPDATAAVRHLVECLGPQTDPAFANALLEAVATSRSDQWGDILLDHRGHCTPLVQRSLFGVLLRRTETTRRLLDTMEAGASITELALDQQVTLATHPDEAIRAG